MSPQLTRKPDVTAEVLPDGSMVLFDTAKMIAYPISASGAVIWEAYDGSSAHTRIVDDLLTVYDTSRDEVERDASAFVAKLVEIGLLFPATADEAGKR
jgi:hypothetical protein